jgi:hypothetical protein
LFGFLALPRRFLGGFLRLDFGSLGLCSRGVGFGTRAGLRVCIGARLGRSLFGCFLFRGGLSLRLLFRSSNWNRMSSITVIPL